MATLPSTRLVPVEEYLNSSYHPDLEYVDGVLVELSMHTIAHSLLQDIVSDHLAGFMKPLGFQKLPAVRTQIVSGRRYRIPDLELYPVPLPKGTVIDNAPWVVIEILSPEDRLNNLVIRLKEFHQIGTQHIVVLDPELLTAYRFEDGSLIKTRFTHLNLPTGSLPFDTEALFRELSARMS
jgi:Uma2 family endonuclease